MLLHKSDKTQHSRTEQPKGVPKCSSTAAGRVFEPFSRVSANHKYCNQIKVTQRIQPYRGLPAGELHVSDPELPQQHRAATDTLSSAPTEQGTCSLCFRRPTGAEPATTAGQNQAAVSSVLCILQLRHHCTLNRKGSAFPFLLFTVQNWHGKTQLCT